MGWCFSVLALYRLAAGRTSTRRVQYIHTNNLQSVMLKADYKPDSSIHPSVRFSLRPAIVWDTRLLIGWTIGNARLKNRKCTEWPQTRFEIWTAKTSSYTLTPKAKICRNFAVWEQFSRYKLCFQKSVKMKMHRMTSKWYWALNSQSILDIGYIKYSTLRP